MIGWIFLLPFVLLLPLMALNQHLEQRDYGAQDIEDEKEKE